MKKNTTGIMESIAILNTIPNGTPDFSSHLAETNKPKEYQSAWQQIVALGKKFKETEADKKLVFKAAYGANTSFNIRNINALLRKLAEWINEFMVEQDMIDSGFIELARANYLKDMGSTKEYRKALLRIIEKAEDLSEAKRAFLHQHAYEALYFLEKEKNEKGDNLMGLLDKAKEAINNYFLIHQLKIIIEQSGLNINGGQDFDEKELKEQQNYFALAFKKSIPLISLQILVVKYYQVRNLDAYFLLKTAYFDKVHLLRSEQKSLLLYLMNALAFMKPPMVDVMQEYFALFKFGFDNDIFLEDGALEYKLFNNFVFVLRSLRQYSLLKDFISSHDSLVRNKNERIAAVQMAKCYLLIGEGKYFTALKDLAFVEPSYPVFTIRKYMSEIICTYEHEKDKYEAFLKIEKIADNFKQLLYKYRAKGKINMDYYKASFNFLKFALTTSNTITHKNTKESLTTLLNSFEGLIAEKSWILEKIKAMPIWNSIEKIKQIYDSTWKKYDALEKIQILTISLKRKLLRYKKAGYINQETQKSCLNFLNLIYRICDERNPKNSRRHLIQCLKSFDEQIIEKGWLEEKIKKIKL